MSEREFAIAVVRRLRERAIRLFGRRGCVHKSFSAWRRNDSTLPPMLGLKRSRTIFRRTVAVGVSFGVIQVLGPREDPQLSIEVATFRSDGAYIDRSRRNRAVQLPARTAQRRDFTINGLFFIDPWKIGSSISSAARPDLEAHLLRAIGDPRQRSARINSAFCAEFDYRPVSASRSSLAHSRPSARWRIR